MPNGVSRSPLPIFLVFVFSILRPPQSVLGPKRLSRYLTKNVIGMVIAVSTKPSAENW